MNDKSGIAIAHKLGDVQMRDVTHEAKAFQALDPARPTPPAPDVIPPHPHTHAAIAERRLQIDQAKAQADRGKPVG